MLGVSSQPGWASLARMEGWRLEGGEQGETGVGGRGGDATSSLGNSAALASCGMSDFVRPSERAAGARISSPHPEEMVKSSAVREKKFPQEEKQKEESAEP